MGEDLLGNTETEPVGKKKVFHFLGNHDELPINSWRGVRPGKVGEHSRDESTQALGKGESFPCWVGTRK